MGVGGVEVWDVDTDTSKITLPVSFYAIFVIILNGSLACSRNSKREMKRNILFLVQSHQMVCHVVPLSRRTLDKGRTIRKLMGGRGIFGLQEFFLWPIACARIFFWTAALCANFS